jgi:hypothetical protein
MAAAGFTPVSLYYSTVSALTPTAGNLVLGELALNVTDGKLFAKDTIGNVYVLADKTSASGNLPGGTAGAIAYQAAPNSTAFLALGSPGFILTAGASTPVYTNPTAITVGNATLAARATNVAGGFANQIVYQTGANTTGFAPSPSIVGTVLSWNGAGFSWTVGVPSTTAGNLLGGVAGSVPYQSGPSTTTFAATGTLTGQVFTYSTGTSSPSFATATVTIGSTAVNVNGATVTTLAGLTSVTVTQDPTSELQLATKQYVDNSVSAGIHIHTPVVANSTTNVAATYANGGTTPIVTDIAGGTTLTVGTHGLSIEDQVVPATTANGLVAGTPYYVYSVVSPTQITLSATPFGAQITTLTNGTGLSISLAANSGVGATLTSTTNGPLVVNGYTAQLNNRILLSGQTAGLQNGAYVVSQVGVVGVSPWILTRATDANKFIPNSTVGLSEGSYFLVTGGTQASSSFICTNPSDIIFGTTSILFTLFTQGGGSGSPPALLVTLTQNFGGF